MHRCRHRPKVFSVIRVGLFVLLSAIALEGWTEEEVVEAEAATTDAEAEQEALSEQSAIYLPLKPAFVVNYGGAGRLKYLKAEVAVRLANSNAANAVRHHMPYIRNNLVMLFTSQTDESLSSQAGKESLRQDALAEIRSILRQEDGLEEGVVDVFFNSLIVQK